MRNRTGCCVLALWLMAMAPWAWASSPAPAATACAVDSASLANSAGVLQDESRTLTPAQVMQLPDTAFQPIVSGRYMGNSKSEWWLRFKLRNAGAQPCERWLVVGPARGGDVRVYVPDGGGWKRMVAGTTYPFDAWALPERRPVFPVQLKPGATAVLAQVVNKGQALSFTPRLWAPEAFLRRMNQQSLTDGLIGGSVMLLALISLVLSALYRRPPLLYMALATGLYVVHVALFKNYLFMYVWPGWPALNLWARFFFINMHFVAFFAYLYTVVRVNRMRRWGRRILYGALSGFVLLALLGSFFPVLALASALIIGLYEGLLLILTIRVGYNLASGQDRHWFPPLLLGALCLQNVVVFGQLVGLHVKFWGANYIAAPMVLILGVFLLGTLFSQARKGRQAELYARAALDQQRVTEAERLERTVAQRTAELDRALKTRRQLLGRISHDLRSPLVGMLDSVRQWRAGDAGHDYPQLIERRAHQQMDMIEELLEFSHAELAEMEPRPIPGYLHAFLNEVAEQTSLTAERHGSRLQRQFAADLPALVSVDFHYLRRVLINLLDNAGKFTDRGRIRFSVQARSAAPAGRVRLRFMVDDNGPGIVPADRERLMRPFVRGDDTSPQEGHGLGLAIVTQLLETMGGQLHIDSAPGGGSRFQFELEVARAAEGDLDPVMEETDIIDIDGADRVILVVDDEPMQRELTCDLFDSYGFDSVAAADGRAAMEVLQNRSADLVLTDQYMDGMDGWGLLQAVRTRCPGVPVLLYSSVPPQPPAEMMPQATFDAVLLKPSDGTTLLRQVESLLGSAASTAVRRAAT